MVNLLKKYQTEILPELQKNLRIKNPMAVPRLLKIVINVSSKEMLTDKKVVDKISQQLEVISGQKPVVRRAKKAIAAFKLRENDPIGVAVTLRGKRMYDFWQKLVTIVLPRVRDFRGVPINSFDRRGNYTLGLLEQIVFPEIEYDSIDKIRGLEVIIVTSAKSDKEAKELLTKLGMPFSKES